VEGPATKIVFFYGIVDEFNKREGARTGVSAGATDNLICAYIRRTTASFVSCSFIHAKGSLNIVVHKLAKFSEFFIHSVWCVVAPECIYM
jgi:hypothetical protein